MKLDSFSNYVKDLLDYLFDFYDVILFAFYCRQCCYLDVYLRQIRSMLLDKQDNV